MYMDPYYGGMYPPPPMAPPMYPPGPMMHRGGYGSMNGPYNLRPRHPGIQPSAPPSKSRPPPITDQPEHEGGPEGRPDGAPQWLEPPPPPPGCPPGLEYLAAVDRILVEQMIEPLEIISGIETCNRYRLLNALGLQVYFAVENSDYCSRQCCGSRREFMISILDNMGVEVMRVLRPFKCCGSCFCACCEPCQYQIAVEAPAGTPIAYAKQVCSVCGYNFVIADAGGVPYCYVKGPCYCACPCKEQKFPVLQGDNKIGEITKHFTGMYQEMISDADNFSVSFPPDMPIPMKASLIGLLFLIDFIAFENNECQSCACCI